MKKLIIANWKSHKSQEAAQSWCREFLEKVSHPTSSEQTSVIIAPPTPLLLTVGGLLQAKREVGQLALALGAQDASRFPMGAYTGEVSAASLRDLGVSYVIVGHSERRQYFHETEAEVASKVMQVLDADMTPILCLDEPYAQSQLAQLDSAVYEKIVIAYEPLGAIGTGKRVSVGAVEHMRDHLRSLSSETTPVLYGGSVSSESVGEYLLVTDGVLVGGASLDASEFATLVMRATNPA